MTERIKLIVKRSIKYTLVNITVIPAPAGCDIVDTIALSGNIDSVGKVTYYYGAVLVRSDIPEEDLAEYYRQFEYNEKCIDVEKQESQKPEGIRAASALDRDCFMTQGHG